MMKGLTLGACLLAALTSVSEAKKMKAPAPAGPAAQMRAAVSFSAPKGWTEEAHANGPDPVLTLKDGLDRITLRLYGAKGSAYAGPDAFLRGPSAGTLGAAPKAVDEAAVAGESRPIWEHAYPIMLGDPHVPASGLRPPMAKERFVLLPLPRGLFVVAGYAYESPVPPVEAEGEAAFRAFLKTLRPAVPPKKPSKK
jgi:hypothetical protein